MVPAALSAMSTKTDRNDARGIAQLMRMGWFRAVHAKSVGSRELRALLVARKQLLSKLMDLEASMRGILRGFGLKMGVVTRKGFEARVRELSAVRRCWSGSRGRCWMRELRVAHKSSVFVRGEVHRPREQHHVTSGRADEEAVARSRRHWELAECGFLPGPLFTR